MARPLKSGLDYFPLNVDIDQDDKTMLIESEFGIVGFGIIIKMLCKIYANGYYYEWGEKEQLLFSKRINVDRNEVIACINSAIKWDLFDKNLYEQYGILTSKGIQKRFIEAVGRRKSLDIIKEYWLLDIPESEKTEVKIVNVDINKDNVNINSQENAVNTDINTQSKVKKSKVNNNKENNIKDIIDYLNLKINSNYKSASKATQKHINARLSEGFTIDDFKTVINKKYDEWYGTDMQQYLRPETLFGTKFESYLNAPAKKGEKKDEKPKYGDGSIYANLEC